MLAAWAHCARRTRCTTIVALQRGIYTAPSAEKGVGGEAPPRHPGATVVLTSGGLESAALLAYWSHWSHASDLIPLFVNLGQRNALLEEAAVRAVCARLSLPSPEVLALNMLGEQFAEMGRGEKHHARVSLRNLTLLSLAASTAAEVGAAHVAIAVSRDHGRSSDASLPFLRHAEALLHVLEPPIALLAPFAQLSTAKVVEIGERVGAPWEATWSCVEGGEEHCGACEPCRVRAEALAGVGRDAWTAPGIATQSVDFLESWHPLALPLLWEGDEAAALAPGSLPSGLSPSWKVILLSDGSVTRHLQLMTGLPVEVECLEMRRLEEADLPGLPAATSLLEGPLLQRQVLLHLPEPLNRPFVYAASWWNADTVNEYLKDKSQPIWVSLSRERTEMYRQIINLEYGESELLEKKFGAPGPFWGRSYYFWHGGRPLTLIYEVFSNALGEFLGPPFPGDGPPGTPRRGPRG